MQLDAEDLRARIKRVLVDRLLLEGLAAEDIGDDTPLVDELGLDSIDALELILGLEQEFDVQIVSRGIDRDALRTVDALAELVETCRAE